MPCEGWGGHCPLLLNVYDLLLIFFINFNNSLMIVSGGGGHYSNQSVFDGVGKSLDRVFVNNTGINNNIHAEIKSMPPIGVIIPTLILLNLLPICYFCAV